MIGAFVSLLLISCPLIVSSKEVGRVKRFDWQDDGRVYWSMNCDFFGGDLTEVKVPGEQCGPACAAIWACKAFTWTPQDGGTCYMKSQSFSRDQARHLDNAVCGLKKESGPPTSEGDSKLWGLAYSPFRQEAGCSTEQQINDDLAKIATIAMGVRTYGLDCDFASKLVQLTRNHGLKLMLGMWITGDDNQYRGQKSKLESLLQSRPDMSHVIAINVGNEVRFRNELSEQSLIDKINDIRNTVRQHGYNTPVTTVDVFDKYTDGIIRNVDIIVPNLHSYFAHQNVDQSPNIVFDLVNRIKSKAGDKEVIVGETGWPSGGAGDANPGNSWKYLKSFHCRANREGLKYFYFEAFNAQWKNLGDGNIESHWGIGTSGRDFKGGYNEALQC